MSEILTKPLTAKDFATDQDVRWCPGCGDYSILKQVQSIMPELGRDKERHRIYIRNWLLFSFSVLYEYLWHAQYSWQSYCDC